MKQALILVVEEEQGLAELTRELLEAEGYRVVLAPHGEAALVLLEDLKPDLILAEMMLPVVDGLQLLKQLGEKAPPRPRVIATSAIRPYLAEALKLGAHGTLAKPFDVDALLRVVKDTLDDRTTPEEPSPASEMEEARLKAVLELQLNEPDAHLALETVTRWVAAVFDIPICLISMVTLDQHIWEAQCGLPPQLAVQGAAPRSQSFCTHAVVGRTALIISDAAENPFFSHNYFVTQWGIRFYAGTPLTDRLGNALGTLCLMDTKPVRFTYFDLELLSLLGRRVMAELEWRDRRAHPDVPSSTYRYLSYVDEELNILARQAFADALRVLACRCAEQKQPLSLYAIASNAAVTREDVAELARALPRSFIGRLGLKRLGLLVFGADVARTRDAIDALGRGWTVASEVVHTPHASDITLARAEAALGNAGLVMRR